MARNRTSACGGQDPIPAPASGNTIRGRGRGRARGRGRGRIAALVGGQVPIATQGHDRTVPPNAEVKRSRQVNNPTSEVGIVPTRKIV